MTQDRDFLVVSKLLVQTANKTVCESKSRTGRDGEPEV